MTKQEFAELLSAYKMTVARYREEKNQVKCFNWLTSKSEGMFNVIRNYEKSKRIRGLRAM